MANQARKNYVKGTIENSNSVLEVNHERSFYDYA
jgi:hypothetical protein